MLKSLYALKTRTVEERAVFDSLESRGKNYLLKSCKICKCVSADSLYTIGNNDSLDGVVTDIGDLGCVGCLRICCNLLLGLGDVVVIGECVLTDLSEEHILGNLYVAGIHVSRSVVVVESRTCSCVGILDLNRDRLGSIGCLTVLEDSDRDGGVALIKRDDNAVLVNRHDLLITGDELDGGVLGEVCVELVVDSDRLGRIEGKRIILTAEEHGVTGLSDISIVVSHKVEGVESFVSLECEYVCYGLAYLLVSLVTGRSDVDRHSDLFVCLGIVDEYRALAGLYRNDLVVYDADSATGVGVFEKLLPLALGIYVGGDGVDLVGVESDLRLLKIEICEIIGKLDLVRSLVDSVVVYGDRKGILVVRILLDVVYVIGKLVGNVSSTVTLRVDGRHIVLEGVEHIAVYHLAGAFVNVVSEADVTDLHTHCVVVIIDSHLGKETGLLSILIVLGVEFTSGKRGSLKVYGKGELKRATEVLFGSLVNARAVIVVKVTLELNGVGCVVLKVML